VKPMNGQTKLPNKNFRCASWTVWQVDGRFNWLRVTREISAGSDRRMKGVKQECEPVATLVEKLRTMMRTNMLSRHP
jgi:hypothetical protein